MKKWTNTFRVGIYKCTMTYSKCRGLHCEWDPGVPKQALTDQQKDQYRAGRDALLAEVSRELGGRILVVET